MRHPDAGHQHRRAPPTPTPGTLNTVVITFPVAPVAGLSYFVTVIE